MKRNCTRLALLCHWLCLSFCMVHGAVAQQPKPAADSSEIETKLPALPTRQIASDEALQQRIDALWQPTLGRYEQRKGTFGDVLSHFVRAMNEPAVSCSVPEGAERKAELVFPAEELPALQALALATEQMGCSIREPYYMQIGTIIGPNYPQIALGSCRCVASRAYAGPTMVELLSAEQDLKTLEIEVTFRLMWEPQFEIVGHTTEPASFQFTWNEADNDRSTIEIPVKWQTTHRKWKPFITTSKFQLDERIITLDQLAVKWPLCASATTGSLELSRSQLNKTRKTEFGDVTIEQWEAESAAVLVENVSSWPEPKEAILQCFRLEGWDVSPGKPHFLFGGCRLTSNGYRWQSGQFNGKTRETERFTYQTDFSTRELEYVFTNVNVSPRVNNATSESAKN